MSSRSRRRSAAACSPTSKSIELASSYLTQTLVGGLRFAALMGTIARVFDAALADDPDREALVTRGARLSYAELDRLADRAAHALRDLGVGTGDRVAASLPNEADVVVAFHGAMRLGAVWLGVNQALAAPEKRFLLDDAGATLLLADDEVAAGDRLGVRILGLTEWRAAVDAAADGSVGVDVDPHAPAGIAYTSGTTGQPKGAVHSQHNLLVPGAVLVESRGWGPDLRKGDCFPFTVLNMAVLTTLLVAQAGGTSVVMDRIDAEGVAEWIRDEQVTAWNGPPALLHSLAGDGLGGPRRPGVAPRGLDRRRADAPRRSARRSRPSSACRSWPPTGSARRRRWWRSTTPTAARTSPAPSGRPLPHLRVRIAGGDGEDLPTGETGEVRVAPAADDDRYRLMLGYWNRPGATAEVLAGGELHTGDVGFLDDAGNLHIRDRKSLLIIRGGANVYPAEVERVLLEAPGIAACAVVGVPDDRLGERVVAVVEATEADGSIDEVAVRAHCLGRTSPATRSPSASSSSRPSPATPWARSSAPPCRHFSEAAVESCPMPGTI